VTHRSDGVPDRVSDRVPDRVSDVCPFLCACTVGWSPLQVEAGAQVIDINFDEGLLDSVAAMTRFVNLLVSEPEVPPLPLSHLPMLAPALVQPALMQPALTKQYSAAPYCDSAPALARTVLGQC